VPLPGPVLLFEAIRRNRIVAAVVPGGCAVAVAALVGQPNVGKSLLMNRLTGAGAFVSNYPGTTVEVTRGRMPASPSTSLIDTPGTYGLRSGSPEQQITQRILLTEPVDLIVNVVDATVLARNLCLTIELLDFGIPVVVALNQCDRLRPLGRRVDAAQMAQALGVPVIGISAMTRQGLDALVRAMAEMIARPSAPEPLTLGPVEEVVETLEKEVFSDCGLRSPRAWAIACIESGVHALYLAREDTREKWRRSLLEYAAKRKVSRCPSCAGACGVCGQSVPAPATVTARRSIAQKIARACVSNARPRVSKSRSRAGGARALGDSPAAISLALLVATYLIVAGTVRAIQASEHLASVLFCPIQAWLTGLFQRILGTSWVGPFLAQALSEGLMVPFGTVMPAMVMIYVLMAVLEDSGLLSRFSAALDSLASTLGLPGQSVIPLALGLGCRSPAILATRVLPGLRERVIVITLLSIAVPCAATLGIVASVIARFSADARVVGATMAGAFLAIGAAAKAWLPGRDTPLVIEVPPLRLPSLDNIFVKTWLRMSAFFTHVLPMLVGMNVLVRLTVESGWAAFPDAWSRVTSRLLGVRAEVLAGVIATAVQRYLAPVVLLNLELSSREATIASAMVSVSFPCAPVTALALGEIGARRTGFIFLLGAVFPLAVAALLNLVLP